jgi:LytS/YehU family sensor histidine kinase
MDAGELLGLLIVLGIPTALVVFIVKLRRTRKQLDALVEEKDRISVHRDTLIKENAQLEAENALLRTDNLKIQLEPHTVKNIMGRLQAYASNLSHGMDTMMKTMDYVLYKGSTHAVSVEEEVDFMRSYMDMQAIVRKERDGMELVTDKIDKNSRWYTQPCIPHLVTGYLLENAFKHGDVEHPEFLRVVVSLVGNDFRMEVMNKIGKKHGTAAGGIGLKNMNERLESLLDGSFQIEHGHLSADMYRAVITITFKT